MAEVKKKSHHRSKGASSAHSSSTESLNSIPVSSDGEGDQMKLKQKEEPNKRPPPLPPRPTRASTIDFSERKASVKRQSRHRGESMGGIEEDGGGARRHSTGENGEKAKEEEKKEGEGEEGEEGGGQPKSRWASMWKSTTSTMNAATSSVTSAVTNAKDATVNAAVKTKDATVNAAVTVKDTTVNAAVKTKDATVNAAVTVKDTTVNAAVTAKDATVTAAVTAKDATVNAAVTAKDTTVNAASTTTSAVTGGFANVVVMAKKARKRQGKVSKNGDARLAPQKGHNLQATISTQRLSRSLSMHIALSPHPLPPLAAAAARFWFPGEKGREKRWGIEY